MTSSWGTRLEKKLNGLADTASKESIQTYSNWIAFNRKHVQTITSVLSQALQDNKDNDKRQWLFWEIINEILVREKANAVKWERLSKLRPALGEALQTTMKQLGNTMPDQLGKLLEEWEDLDVFGGPSLNAEIRLIFQNRKNLTTIGAGAMDTAGSSSTTTKLQEASTPSTAEASMPTSQSGDGDEIISGSNDNDDDMDTGEGVKQPQEPQRTSTAMPSPEKSEAPPKSPKEQAEYDFESKGVPSGPVESRDFMDPCKAISSLQIARDIRTSTAVETSAALEKLPTDVQTACEDLSSGKLKELDASTTNDFSIRIPSTLIDLDIDEEASNLNMFQDIVQRQQKAREKLIYLLLRSRCKFGATEAAKQFYEIDGLAQNLKSRKELLSDALELEGLDTAEIEKDSKFKKRKLESDLPQLAWYKSENEDESNKKQKVA